MRFLLLVVMSVASFSAVHADAMAEVNEWRRRSGLRPFIEDPSMTQFAEMKARYRAERHLRDGHQGPSAPPGWHEGTGEAAASWGWLTCEMESDFQYAGASMCVGSDGTRYMVLVCRGGSGRALLARNHAPVHKTSHLSPNPPRVGTPSTVTHSGAAQDTSLGAASFRATKSTPQPCPSCGKYH